MRRTVRTSVLGVAAIGAGLALAPSAAASPGPAAHSAPAGAIYLESNQVAGNAVLEYRRAADGTLTGPRTYPTGGTGTGTGLGSQGAVVLDRTATHLYAVDAGSNGVTSFAVTPRGLRKVDSVPSGGTTPVSVTVRGDRLYVVNAGGTGTISGFAVDDGRLRPLANSTRPLSGPATGPAQISFTPDGTQLVVTEKTTSSIDLYGLDRRGVPTSHAVVPSSGSTPFGFAFDRSGRLVVSEAGAGTVSTYAVRPGALRTISASVPTTEAAACWVVATGRYVYTGNGGGSNSITGFRESARGTLTLLEADGQSATTAGGVSDVAVDRPGRHLYARLGNGTVGAFRIGADGELTALPVAAGVPAGSAGLAAR